MPQIRLAAAKKKKKKTKLLVFWSSECDLGNTNIGIPQELIGNAKCQAPLQTSPNQHLLLTRHPRRGATIFTNVSPLEGIQTIEEIERKRYINTVGKTMWNSLYKVLCDQNPIVEHTTRESDLGVTC